MIRKTHQRTTKITAIFFCLLLLSGFYTSLMPVSAAKPKVKAHSYLVMDANSGKALYSQNPSKRIYPASTAKIMTALVALENAKETKKIKFTKQMKKQVNSASIAHLGLKAGATYQVRDYLHMLLLSSDADSAYALAVGSCGSTKKFVKKMNAKAKALGMKSTSFDNPVGLDIGNNYKKTYTTAKDFAVMARYAMSISTIREIVATSSYKVPKTSKSKAFTIHSTNAFYSGAAYDDSLYEVIGMKTGFTSAAGYTFIGVARDIEGHEVICTFFGKSSSARRYKDVKNLFNYTFQQYDKEKINLSVGFWDTRFLASEKVIQKYAKQGLLSTEEERFYPKRNVTEAEFIELINGIGGMTLTASSNKKMVTVQMAADYIYRDDVMIAQKKVDAWMSKLSNVPAEDAARNRLAALYEHRLMDVKSCADAGHKLTREEAVLLADKLANQ